MDILGDRIIMVWIRIYLVCQRCLDNEDEPTFRYEDSQVCYFMIYQPK